MSVPQLMALMIECWPAASGNAGDGAADGLFAQYSEALSVMPMLCGESDEAQSVQSLSTVQVRGGTASVDTGGGAASGIRDRGYDGGLAQLKLFLAPWSGSSPRPSPLVVQEESSQEGAR